MHHLRLDLHGPDLAADLLRARLEALGAERVDSEGRLLVLVTALEPAAVKREVVEDVPRCRIDVERFERYGREVATERWNLRSVTARSSRRLDDAGRVPGEDDRWRRERIVRDPYWDGWSPVERPAELLPATRASLEAVRGRPSPGVAVDREDVLGFLVALGRLARSGSAGDPAMLDAAAFLLEQGARATARSAGAAELAYERGLLLTRVAWAVDRRASDEPLLEALEALAAAGARLTRWARTPELWARGLLPEACYDGLVGCARAMTPAGEEVAAVGPGRR